MSETGREIPVGLNEFHVVRLFKCAESGVFAPTLLVFCFVACKPRFSVFSVLGAVSSSTFASCALSVLSAATFRYFERF